MDEESSVLEKLTALVSNNERFYKRSGDDEALGVFWKKFPADKLGEMSVEDYVLGSGSRAENFCWWLERGLEKALGRYSPGSARGHLIYIMEDGSLYKHRKLKQFDDVSAMHAIAKVHQVIATAEPKDDWLDNRNDILMKAGVDIDVIMGLGRRLRLVAMYHPDSFLPISSSTHLLHFLTVLGVPQSELPSEKKAFSLHRKLFSIYESVKQQVPNLTPNGFMKALYSDDLGIRPIKEQSNRVEEINDEEAMKMEPFNLNTILYGPPGTGKTYATTEMSVQIAEPDKYQDIITEYESQDLQREEVKKLYDELVESGRIVFTTFHQSFSYEDFIEGIRAIPSESGEGVFYDVQDGVFKLIADRSEKSVKAVGPIGLSQSPRIWKVSIGRKGDSEMREQYLQSGEARIGWNNTGDLSLDYEDRSSNEQEYWNSLTTKNHSALTSFSEDIQIGDVLVCLKDSMTIQAIGVVTSDYGFDPTIYQDGNGYAHFRKVDWLLKDIDFNILPINKDRKLVQQTVYPLNRISWDDVLAELAKQNIPLNADLESAETVDEGKTKPNHVIIIDEINRGNVSRIFGELITLLEADKRKGGADSKKIILPYSKEEFSVPANLYVIGTMNTADKSLAQVDLALRRRFSFVEMLPKPSLLKGVAVHGLLMSELLSTINSRIEVLLDRDHLIGHSYFWALKGLESETDAASELANIFENKVIPLLQDYFFSDWERISWVLNDLDKPRDQQFIQLESSNNDLGNLFSSKIITDVNDRRYTINSDAFHNPESYRSIFVSKGQ